MDDQLSLKGAWSRQVTHFKFLAPKISLEQLKLDFKFCTLIDHIKYHSLDDKLSFK